MHYDVSLLKNSESFFLICVEDYYYLFTHECTCKGSEPIMVLFHAIIEVNK